MPSDDEIRAICSDPSLSYWFRNALTTALERDPLDAAHDAGLLAMVLDRRATQVLATSQAELVIEKARKSGSGADGFPAGGDL